jgi:hypothetical protein
MLKLHMGDESRATLERLLTEAKKKLLEVSRIAPIDGVAVTLFDGLPASASRRL